MFYFVFGFVFCFCCFFALVVVVVVFFNEYVTMNFSERPGINALKTGLTMLVEEYRKYQF